MIVIPSHGDVLEAVLKRLVLGRLLHIEEEIGGRGFMVVDDPVMAGQLRNRDGSFRWARGGAKGTSDIRIVLRGRAWGIEIKTRQGRQSEPQREYQFRLERAGGCYYIARTCAEALIPVCDALGLAYEVQR